MQTMQTLDARKHERLRKVRKCKTTKRREDKRDGGNRDNEETHVPHRGGTETWAQDQIRKEVCPLTRRAGWKSSGHGPRSRVQKNPPTSPKSPH